jgi:HSP20 family protein
MNYPRYGIVAPPLLGNYKYRGGNELRRMQETMNHLWRGFGAGITEGQEMETWAGPLNVVQQGDNFIIRASLPGVNPDNIDVSIEDNVLTIRGQSAHESEHQEGNYLVRERRSGSFYRVLRLPDTADTDQAHPFYEHGVLTITIPKAESKKAKQLKVSVNDRELEGAKS